MDGRGLLDLLPAANLFAARAPWVGVAWRTLLCVVLVGAFRYLEHVLPPLFHGTSPADAHRELLAAIPWHRLWATVIWLLVLFLGFFAAREIGRVLGGERLWRLFNRPGAAAGPSGDGAGRA